MGPGRDVHQLYFSSDGGGFLSPFDGVVNEQQECNRLVNEQVEVGFLMAGPAILGALSLRAIGDHAVLFPEIRRRSRYLALALPGYVFARAYLADGLHHHGQRRAENIFLERDSD